MKRIVFYYYYFWVFVFSLPLIRKKSLLEEIIKTDQHEVKNINYDKITPTNETISLFKYLDVSFIILML